MNWYGYVGGNPVMWVDPEGEFAQAAVLVYAVPGFGEVAAVVTAAVGIGYVATHPDETQAAIGAVANSVRSAATAVAEAVAGGPTVCPANRYRHPGRPQRLPRQIGPEEARPKPDLSKKPPKPPKLPYGPDSPGKNLPPFPPNPRPFTEPPPGINMVSPPWVTAPSRADMARQLSY